jgi:hypothetical protein
MVRVVIFIANPLGSAKKAYPAALIVLRAFIGNRRFIASIFTELKSGIRES